MSYVSFLVMRQNTFKERIWAHSSKDIHYVGIPSERKAAMYFTTVKRKRNKDSKLQLTHSEAVWRTRKLKDYIVLLLESSMMFYFSPKPPLIQGKQINSVQKNEMWYDFKSTHFVCIDITTVLAKEYKEQPIPRWDSSLVVDYSDGNWALSLHSQASELTFLPMMTVSLLIRIWLPGLVSVELLLKNTLAKGT